LDHAPAEIKSIATPRVRRQIWLKSAQTDVIFAYAVSWWHKQDLETFLPDPNLPIGTNLSKQKLEVYRDLRGVYRGKCPTLDGIFGVNSPNPTYWGRHYLLWHQGKPLNLIYEIFHPCLRDYLGAESL
jgi:chorismate lyase